MPERALTVVQVLPALEVGGVERGTLEVAAELVRRGHRAVVVSAGGRLVEALTAGGAEHVCLPVGRKRLSTLRLAGPLAGLLAGVDADIVHVRSRLPAWITALALRRLPAARRPARVTTVHGPYTVNAYSAIMTRGDRVIAISRFIRDYILENYRRVEPQRVQVIPRGIDPVEFPNGLVVDPAWEQGFRTQFELPREAMLVTQAARITRWKGQADFLAVIRALRQRGLPVIGLLAGTAESRQQGFHDELQASVRANGLETAVRFIGNRSDLRSVLAISAASVSLTREPEAFGRTTLESLSLGTPVVGYAHGGTQEILEALYPAGLCPVGDTAAVAERLAALLASPVRLPAHGQFQLQDMLDATLAVYASLAGQRDRA